ncbi:MULTISPECIES: hypothetical protein [Sphingobium]|uniref:Uncharacterized protein n=1 Tax=Sphingobium cupriresistens LL01 TaxID=1420583 RepID=A0A0J7XP07_9SPHN|nr:MULTISPECIES: hypothetical protein [Sphingobium]KMS53364.1 hypothetical protein V473_19035 [Sphingobium cupriresistens LL01]MBJ7376730.1 hypothetical protein [Sphingobium sp.]
MEKASLNSQLKVAVYDWLLLLTDGGSSLPRSRGLVAIPAGPSGARRATPVLLPVVDVFAPTARIKTFAWSKSLPKVTDGAHRRYRDADILQRLRAVTMISS